MYESVFTAFLYLQFVFVMSRQKEIGAKVANRLLAKFGNRVTMWTLLNQFGLLRSDLVNPG